MAPINAALIVASLPAGTAEAVTSQDYVLDGQD